MWHGDASFAINHLCGRLGRRQPCYTCSPRSHRTAPAGTGNGSSLPASPHPRQKAGDRVRDALLVSCSKKLGGESAGEAEMLERTQSLSPGHGPHLCGTELRLYLNTSH